jgi:small subunit ribosomal protein S8
VTCRSVNSLIQKIFNAQHSRKIVLVHLKTKICLRLVYLLKREGFIIGFSFFQLKHRKFIKIFLKYKKFLPTITKVKIISKSSQRIFLNYKSIVKNCSGIGLLVIHTNRGLLSNKQSIHFNLGGEVLLFVN